MSAIASASKVVRESWWMMDCWQMHSGAWPMQCRAVHHRFRDPDRSGLSLFSEQPADAAIIEVGMGGRWIAPM